MPRKRLAVGAGAAVILAVGAGVAGDQLVSSSDDSKPARPRAERDAPRGFVRFRDRPTGFSIAYPTNWVRLPSRGEVKLLAARAGASFSLRVSKTGIDIGPGSLGPARSITDKLVSEAGGVKLVRKPEVISLGGLPGYLYLYTFDDADTGQRGVHAHYFLFQGQRMFALVFQTLPAASFRRDVRTFDTIAKSLRVRPSRARTAGT